MLFLYPLPYSFFSLLELTPYSIFSHVPYFFFFSLFFTLLPPLSLPHFPYLLYSLLLTLSLASFPTLSIYYILSQYRLLSPPRTWSSRDKWWSVQRATQFSSWDRLFWMDSLPSPPAASTSPTSPSTTLPEMSYLSGSNPEPR